MYEDICKERAIIINRQLKDSPAIDANKAQILQAIENLLSNAVDAMPGGGSLMVLAERETVGEASFVKVTVKDTGQGIEEEDKVRIFEPFFTTNLLLKGTGLGLSITKKVIEDHGGFIHVDSRVGEGSTFCLYFPLGPGR
jgi:signal transduction histidine kinase